MYIRWKNLAVIGTIICLFALAVAVIGAGL
jgi:hypothetical protein